ncbi:hypothetical protein ATERTT37_006959 [Aspergillus terreus]
MNSSAVLLASLERSKKKWLSDGILVRYWTKPKKTKREQIEGKNPPKDTITTIPIRIQILLSTLDNIRSILPPMPPRLNLVITQVKRHPHTKLGPQATLNARRPVLSPPNPNQPPQPAKPSPDPVIQMLATRAASDPELKALMRVVASSKASQEQLRAFQAHIDELNAIIRAREQHQLRQQQQQQQQGPPYPPYQQGPYQGQQPALQSRPPQYGSPASHYRQAPPPPPRQNYKSVVFEFTSPLTPYGSSTSGHAGSGDRYLFPEYSILEWLPGGNTVLASFLLVRKVDPNTPFPIETGSETGNSRAKGKSSKSKKADKSKGKNAESEKGKDTTSNQSSTPATDAKENATQATPAGGPAEKSDDKAAAASGKQANKDASTDKPEDAKKADNLKEYYQPVTFRIHSTNPKVLEPLGRVVKPPDEVRKYMNEIMDRAERAPDGFLAFRLPREEPDEPEAEDSNIKKGGTPVATVRSRLSKSKTVDNEESDIENRENPAEDEEEEELLDYYGPPMGLVPMGV